MKDHRLLKGIVFFVSLVFFLLFFMRNENYDSSHISIKTKRHLTSGAVLQVDDGDGYNKYQTVKLYGKPFFIPKQKEVEPREMDRIDVKYDTVITTDRYVNVKGQAWVRDRHSIGSDIKVLLVSDSLSYIVDTYQYPGERDFYQLYNNSETAFDCFFEKRDIAPDLYDVWIQVELDGEFFYHNLKTKIEIPLFETGESNIPFAHLGAMQYNKNIITFETDDPLIKDTFYEGIKDDSTLNKDYFKYISAKSKILNVVNKENFLKLSLALKKSEILNSRTAVLATIGSYGIEFHDACLSGNDSIVFEFDSRKNRKEIAALYLVFPLKYKDDVIGKEIAIDSFPLPHSTIEEFRIISNDNLEAYWHLGKDSVRIEKDENGYYSAAGISSKTETTSTFLIIFQILAALFTAWLVFEAFKLYLLNSSSGWKSGFKNIFFAYNRKVFWIFFGISFLYFFSWLLGQWPGAMSIDSFNQWSQVKSLEFDAGHPYINQMLYLYLTQFADTPAMVGLFHILIVSGLSSYIFYYLYKKGLRLYYVLPFYLIFLLMPTVAMFNLLVWKDIVFAILVTFWGFIIYVMVMRKKEGKSNILTFKQIFVLTLLLTAVCIFRHNGIIFIIFIPAVIAINRVLKLEQFLVFFLLSLLSVMFFRFILPETMDWKSEKGVANPEYIKEMYERRIETLFTTIELEKVHYNKAQLFDIPEDADTLKFEEKSVLNVERVSKITADMIECLIYPKEQFFNALEYNLYRLHENRRSYVWWLHYPDVHRLHTKPIVEFLYTIQHNIIKVVIFPELTPLFFNNLVPMFIVFLSLIFFRRNPATASFAFLVLIQFFALFLLGVVARNFRYIYFLYFSAFFMLPMMILEFKNNREKRTS
jgi:hypothetical protein